MGMVIDFDNTSGVLSLKGTAEPEKTSEHAQHILTIDTSTIDHLIIDCTGLQGNSFLPFAWCMVLSHHFGANCSVHFRLSEAMKNEQEWFEPVWSNLISEVE